MINWLHQEEGYCEGEFESAFFRNDENSGDLFVYATKPELSEGAEKCVEAFNNLSEIEISEICKGIIGYVEESDRCEGFEFPDFESELDILKYCWFFSLYVNMLSNDDEISYCVEGEGDWGDLIGFVVSGGKLIYVGTDYFEYMKEEEL